MTTSQRTEASAKAVTHAPRRAGLEVPILFQLADLSRFTVITPSLSLSSDEKPAPTPSESSCDELPIPATPAPATRTAEAQAPQFVTGISGPATTAAATDDAKPVMPPQRTLASAPEESKPSVAVESSTLAAEPPLTLATLSANETKGPTDESAPTLRQRAESRERKRQESRPHSDWFNSHGKVIAVGFVLALIATIYLARTGDEPALRKHEPEAQKQADSTGEGPSAGSDSAVAGTVPGAAADKGPGTTPVLLSESAASAPAGENPAGPRAELHVPAATPADANSQPADAGSLFPWKEEPRVATRPDSPVIRAPQANAADNPAQATPHRESAPAGEAPSIYGPASTSTGYPAPASHTEGGNRGPETNAPVDYPVTNPSTYRDFTPQSQRGQDLPNATPASYGKNIPPSNRTSGPRYERTGSGLY